MKRKIQFKHQQFQEDASLAVCNVFKGMSKASNQEKYMMSRKQMDLADLETSLGYRNNKILLDDNVVLTNIRNIQIASKIIKPSEKLERNFDEKCSLSIEMETGVGKTYTYIKTIYELNRQYGWTKFIIVVPSIAIREGVKKSFETTTDHFMIDYGEKIIPFIYSSNDLSKLVDFARSSRIEVMIINSQSFNSKDNKIHDDTMESFKGTSPIKIVAQTNPILIIDEPQSVEGDKTKLNMKEFNPLFILKYSATFKKNDKSNRIYCLDAIDAYNKGLVKKISVKGIVVTNTGATDGYLYLSDIRLFKDKNPEAIVEYNKKGNNSVNTTKSFLKEGSNLYELSGKLEEYNNYIISEINGEYKYIRLTNGDVLYVGEIRGTSQNEDNIRRVQIRETIKTHLERERQLFKRNIKVLSLFFIDKVAKYREYDDLGKPMNGDYVKMFEKEYKDIVENYQFEFGDEEYQKYLANIRVENTHSGYFSIDKFKHFKDSKETDKDSAPYELIMKNKEVLLDLEGHNDVRFIFSHSALKEGWDNPNVFQICTLKDSKSEIRKRQEIGRGLRLCVDRDGNRIERHVNSSGYEDINLLTVIANESYEDFTKQLQQQIADDVVNRPREITKDLFKGNVLVNAKGEELNVDETNSKAIMHMLIKSNYVDEEGQLTEKWHNDKNNGQLNYMEYDSYRDSIDGLLNKIYDGKIDIENANKVKDVKINRKNLDSVEFKELWKRINKKSYYTISFDSDELIKNCIDAINSQLLMEKLRIEITQGEMNKIGSKEELESNNSFEKKTRSFEDNLMSNTKNKYDLIGKILEETNLTRGTIAKILTQIDESKFMLFTQNPEDFIIKVSKIINEQKATLFIQHVEKHIKYEPLNSGNKDIDEWSTEIFTNANLRGTVNNILKTKKNVFEHLLFDSEIEKEFGGELEKLEDISVYVKLPRGFYINTPVGHYNPDWAISYKSKDGSKHVYFVAETKGTMNTMELRNIEQVKINCATEHFKAISNGEIKYKMVKTWKDLLNIINNEQ